MLSAAMILESLTDIFIIVKDLDGNIQKPTNLEDLTYIEKVIKNGIFYDDNTIFYEKENRWFKVTTKYVKKDNKTYQIQQFYDITVFKNKENELQIDGTTNLPNKTLTFERIDEYLKEALDNKEKFAIIMGDIDHFKNINDTYGHVIGDAVLEQIGSILIETTRQAPPRPDDVIGRYGGEEFIILLKNITMNKAVKKTENIRKVIENTDFSTDEIKIDKKITMSFGIFHSDYYDFSIFSDSSLKDVRTNIIGNADMALYISKKKGRNQLNLFEKKKKGKK